MRWFCGLVVRGEGLARVRLGSVGRDWSGWWAVGGWEGVKRGIFLLRGLKYCGHGRLGFDSAVRVQLGSVPLG